MGPMFDDNRPVVPVFQRAVENTVRQRIVSKDAETVPDIDCIGPVRQQHEETDSVAIHSDEFHASVSF
jgi:hypothetical protein